MTNRMTGYVGFCSGDGVQHSDRGFSCRFLRAPGPLLAEKTGGDGAKVCGSPRGLGRARQCRLPRASGGGGGAQLDPRLDFRPVRLILDF